MFDERKTNVMPGYTGHIKEGLNYEVPSSGYKETSSHVPGKFTAKKLLLYYFLIYWN